MVAVATVFRIAAALLLLAGLAVAWTVRDDIFQTLQDPGIPFQLYAPPPEPDYRDPASWISWPDGGLDKPGADVFVLVPEVYKGSESWNLPVDDPRRREKLERIVRPNYVDPYRDAGRLFAPLYRQAALYAFLNNREDSQRAQELAYRDVARAWDAFLASNPPERPIVLVGHGQGAAHARRLIAERMTDDVRRKLAVAYVVDHPVVEAELEIPVCDGPETTGCVAAWTAVMPGEERRAERLRVNALVPEAGRYEPVAGRELVCVNPLSWRADGEAVAADAHLGGVGAVGFEPDVRPVVHRAQVSARCVGELLRVSEPDVRSLRRPRRIGGAFRTLPSNLFYEDLRVNSAARVRAKLAEGVLPVRAEPLGEVEEVGEARVVAEP